jgi:hypothetical protein
MFVIREIVSADVLIVTIRNRSAVAPTTMSDPSASGVGP